MRTKIWASGGGVQSAAIAALIVRGDIDPPDLAVIVDTEREQSTTWAYMDEVITPALATVGVTLHRVPKSQFEHRDLYGGKEGDTFLLPVPLAQVDLTDPNGVIFDHGCTSGHCFT